MISRHILLLALLLWLAPTLARAQVQDDAGFFKPGTISIAQQRIERLKAVTGKGFLLVTAKSMPDQWKKSINLNDAGQAKQAFKKWSFALAQKHGLDGVVAIVCQAPKYVYVGVYPEENVARFSDAEGQSPPSDCERLQHFLVSRMQPDTPNQFLMQGAKNRVLKLARGGRLNYDRALLDAVDFTREKLEASHPAVRGHWAWTLSAVFGLLGLWAVLLVARGRQRRTLSPETVGMRSPHDDPFWLAMPGGGIGAVAGQRVPAVPAEPASSSSPSGERPFSDYVSEVVHRLAPVEDEPPTYLSRLSA